MVLQLLIDHEEHHHHDADRHRVHEPRDRGHNSAEGGPDHRDQVGQRDKQGDQTGERHAADLQHGVGQHAADRADQQVARDVAGDGDRTVPPDPADPLGAGRLQQRQRVVHQPGSFQHAQVGQHEHGDGGHDRAAGSAHDAQRRGSEPGAEFADAVLVVLHPLQGIGAGEQFPDRAAAGAGVRDDSRQLPSELDALLGQRHREQREQAAQQEEDQQKHQQRCQPPGTPAQPALHPGDHRVQRDGEEACDEHPDQHALHLDHEQDRESGAEQQPDRGQDGPYRHARGFGCHHACNVPPKPASGTTPGPGTPRRLTHAGRRHPSMTAGGVGSGQPNLFSLYRHQVGMTRWRLTG